MPRMYGEVDLSEFLIHINYMNANNEGDIYAVDDSEIGSDAITFSWLVGRNAVAYKGTVRFIVCLKLFDENGEVIKEYNTTTGDSAISIGEIGLIASSSNSYTTADYKALYERTVLDTPVTIEAGGVGIVNYSIKLQYPTE